MEILQLNQKNTAQLATKIAVPKYDRSQIKTGIVHIGVGGFHRAHQAYYIHQLLEKFNAYNWGICGLGLREADRKMYNALKKQDGLYTLSVQHPNGTIENEVIGSIKEMILAVDTPDLALKKLANIHTKIVSLTITEGGYNFDAQTGNFIFDNEAVQHDLNHPEKPKTVFGYVSQALRQRKESGNKPFSILSCDNIPHNGNVAREMFLAFAKKQDLELAKWIEKEVSFPNTMVDRITPVTSEIDKTYLNNELQLNDEWPVICEPYIQWVVEDNFCNGRPPLEKVGVQFVPDVLPYEKMKIRLLNAGHSVLGITGAIHGHKTINECMNDSVFSTFMSRFMSQEATPILDPVEGINLEDYQGSVKERFANPNIKDSVSRICSESSAKLPKFLIPTIEANLKTGGSIDYGTFILAAWCYYSDKGVSEKNEPLEIIDVEKDKLHQAAKTTQDDPLVFIRQGSIFGSLIENERFTRKYTEFVGLIYAKKNIKKLMSTMI